jgi:hypothetical protein
MGELPVHDEKTALLVVHVQNEQAAGEPAITPTS